MPRHARLYGEYLHVIVRGIGKQILFEDDMDRHFFMSIIRKYREECGIIIMAYCLMDNHVHLLLKDADANVAVFMKKMGVSYAGYFNKKYERVGHLFQDRYKSEAITDDTSLMAVYRYILNNPQKAGISNAKDYPWSSIHEYGIKGGITDSRMLSAMIGSKKNLLNFLKMQDEAEFMEDVPVKHDDKWAKETIRKMLGTSSGTVLQKMSKAERDENLVALKSAGITIRQLERLTGINRGVIQKAKVVKENRPR